VVALALLVPLSHAYAEQSVTSELKKNAFDGYSYFTVGAENVTYEEKIRVGSNTIKSKADVTSTVINSGGIYTINEMFDFSIDALATFSPSDAEESWNLGGAPAQKNKFEYSRASTNVQLHYKYTPEFRLLAGPAFSYQAYKRYSFEALDSRVDVPEGVVEENSTDIFLDLGMAYESAPVKNTPWRYSLKALVGYPLWSEAKNTQYEGVTFSPSGYRYSLSGNISFEVVTGVHLGVYASYRYDQRDEDGPENFTADGTTSAVYLPEAATTNLTIGAQAIWKL